MARWQEVLVEMLMAFAFLKGAESLPDNSLVLLVPKSLLRIRIGRPNPAALRYQNLDEDVWAANDHLSSGIWRYLRGRAKLTLRFLANPSITVPIDLVTN